MGRSVSPRDLLPLLLAYVTACGSGGGQAHINDEPASLVALQHLGTNGPELKRAGEGVLFGISVGAGVLSGIQAMPASPIDEIRAT